MGFVVDWDNVERTVIMSRVEGEWTWDDLGGQVLDAYMLMTTVDHSVNVIVDGLATVQTPHGDIVRQLRGLLAQRPKNMGLLILVGASPTIRATSHLMSRLYPHSGGDLLRFTNSLVLARNEARVQYR